METKPAIQSLGMQGSLGAILMGAFTAYHGYQTGDGTQLLAGVSTMIAGLTAAYGRYRATRSIQGIVKGN